MNNIKDTKIKIGSETKTLHQWAMFRKMSYDLAYSRYRKGWSGEEVLGLVSRDRTKKSIMNNKLVVKEDLEEHRKTMFVGGHCPDDDIFFGVLCNEGEVL